MTTTTGTKPVRRHGKRCDDDGGYVAVVLALTLSVLILFAGFAVDIGGWYARAAQMQRAADAAALAGVVWMPTFSGSGTTASSVAIATATANGFTTGGSITVTPSQVTGNTRRLKVTITDTSLTQYFSQLAIGSPTITRAATSEYVLPVPLGSPDNTLGNQSNTDTKNLWASISAPYTDYTNGDPYSTKCLVSASNTSCSTNNTEYRNWGYLYTVDVPATGVGKTLTVQVFDAGNYARSNYANVETADNGAVNTSFEMFSPSAFPLDPVTFYDPSISMNSTGSGSIKCTSGGGKWVIADGASSSTYKNNFVTLCTLVVSTAGQYHLQVKSSNITGVADSGNGWNQFSLKATLSGARSPRSTATATCRCSTTSRTSRATSPPPSTWPRSTQVHAGKHLLVSLFDPGDGVGHLRRQHPQARRCHHGLRVRRSRRFDHDDRDLLDHHQDVRRDERLPGALARHRHRHPVDVHVHDGLLVEGPLRLRQRVHRRLPERQDGLERTPRRRPGPPRGRRLTDPPRHRGRAVSAGHAR